MPSERYYATCLQGYTDWSMDLAPLAPCTGTRTQNQKVKPRYQSAYNDRRFDFDDWYKATYPERNRSNGNGNGTALMGDDFIPEDSDRAPMPKWCPVHHKQCRKDCVVNCADRAPYVSKIDGRVMRPSTRPVERKRYEDMRPDEIREAITNHDPARVSMMDSKGQNVFVNAKGERWIKGKNNVWHRAPEGK